MGECCYSTLLICTCFGASGPDPKPVLKGDERTYRIWLDCNQYEIDLKSATSGGEDVYETFNVLMRRKPKENNFKVLVLDMLLLHRSITHRMLLNHFILLVSLTH